MNGQFFMSFYETVFALISGAVFGFLLRKASLTRADTVHNQLLLRDFTLVKIMGSTILVASLGLFLMDALELRPALNLSSLPASRVAIGGGIFGIGLAITGYCPGMMVGAIADGAKDAITGFFGLILGSMLYNLAYPLLVTSYPAFDATSAKTVYHYLGVPEVLIVVMLISASIGFYLFRKFKK